MFLQGFGKLDRILMGLAALIFLLSLYLIVNDEWLLELSSSEIAQLDKIGHVQLSKNDVRRRTRNTFYWLSLRMEKDIYQDDSIFTGPNSEAIIITDRGEEISIAPNSLVVISASADSIFLDIDYGSIQGKVGKDKKLLIGSRDGISEFTSDGGVVQVDVNSEKKLKVSVLQGSVQVKNKGESQHVGPNESIQLDPGHLLKRGNGDIELIAPLSKRAVDSKSNTTSFIWKAKKEFKQFNIQVSRDEKFDDLIVDTKTSNTTFDTDSLPKDQTLYWRVLGLNEAEKPEGNSGTAKFSLVVDGVPQAQFPWDGLRVVYMKSEEGEDLGVDLTFHWRGPQYENWSLQTAANADFTEGLKEYSAKGKSATVANIHSGTFYWRVRATDLGQVHWSATARVQIVVREAGKPLPPQLISQNTTHTLKIKPTKMNQNVLIKLKPKDWAKLLANPPTLEWRLLTGRVKYELEIAKEVSFKNKLAEVSTSKTKFTWATARPGEFFWRVRTINVLGEASEFSSPELIKIKVQPPESTAKKELTEQISEYSRINNKPPPFLLSWKPLPFAESFELEFANNTEFREALRTNVNDVAKKVQAEKPGSYFWRVRALNVKSEAISEFSAPTPIRFFRTYHNPAEVSQLKPLFPASEAAVVLVGTGEEGLRLLWTNPFKGGPYRIQISSAPDFESPVYDSVIAGNRALINDLLPNGWLYWRIRLETENVISPWTGSSRFHIKNEQAGFEFTNANIMSGPQKYKKDRALASKPPPAPQLEHPAEIVFDPNFEFELLKANVVKWPRLSWESIEKAESYQLQFARNPTFTDTIRTFTTKDTFFTWVDSRPGVYFVRIRSLGARPSEFSPTQTIQLSSREPVILNDEVFVEEHTDPRLAANTPKPVLLQWQPSAFARKYAIEVQGTKDLKFIAKSNTYQARLPEFGSYRFRVRALDKYERPISDHSDMHGLEVVRAYRSPASFVKLSTLFPQVNQVLQLNIRKPTNLQFLWQTDNMEHMTLLQISQDMSFSQLFYSSESRGDRLRLNTQFTEGQYYWRVGQRKLSGGVDWTKPIPFTVKGLKPPATLEKDNFWNN